MNKCDFCPDAVNKNGKLKCKWNGQVCMLTDREIKEIMEMLIKIKGE